VRGTENVPEIDSELDPVPSSKLPEKEAELE
jgi:hypothetical protein